MFFSWRRKSAASPPKRAGSAVDIRVVGVGGGGGNALRRMMSAGNDGVKYLALNTDIQALARFERTPTFAIGPETTGGMGSGGRPEIGRKAMRESQAQVSRLMDGADMVFIAAGMGGGTGTGAAVLVADIARKRGALAVGVVTLPFGFEGPRRRENAELGLRQLRQKVDTLIIVENDRLLGALDGKVKLERAFRLADEALRQGVQGISDIVTVNGMINVDFADVKSVMEGGGPAFMATGTGEGRHAATDAAKSALSNPLFDAPLEGASGVLFNVAGGPGLTLGQVHEVSEIIRRAASPNANVIFGVVQDKRMKKRVSVTLIATGIDASPPPRAGANRASAPETPAAVGGAPASAPGPTPATAAAISRATVNGYSQKEMGLI